MVFGITSMKGFTLIELVVVTAIIGLFAVLMLVNYRGGSQGLAEQQTLQVIAQSVRSAQNKALGAHNVTCVPSPCVYYGVHFDTSSTAIRVFASNDNQYDSGEEIAGETRELESGVLITGISSNYVCGASMCLDILFEPPDPTVSFNPAGESATITITGGRSVTVGKGGSVDIQ